jgi:hypothetical protein
MWAVVAADEDPARARWAEAAHEAGVQEPRFVPWRAVLAGEAGFRSGEHVLCERLEGWAPSNPVGGQLRRFGEFSAAVTELNLAAAKAGALPAAARESLLLMLDRLERDSFLRQNGVPVLDTPQQDGGPYDGILRCRYLASDDWIIDGWHTRLYVHRTRTGPEVWLSPAETWLDRVQTKQVIELLEPGSVYAVASLHRCHLGGAFYDIRFEVLDGTVTHAAGVLREQFRARPWYGGRRRELEVFVERFGAERWQRLVALAERTAALFPEVRSLGVDLIVDNHDAEYVFDLDPFGADLPGRVGLPDTAGAGLSVRAALLRALSSTS